MRFESDSNRELWDNHEGLGIPIYRNPKHHGWPFNTLRERINTRQQAFSLWPKFPRGKIREKKRENCSPANLIPNQRRCAHVLRIAAVLNLPLTRTPTRTPCGEAGSEDSWLRVARKSNLVPPIILLLIRHCECRLVYQLC